MYFLNGNQNLMDRHHYFMQKALEEAEKALAANDFPVGCVLVADGQVIEKAGRTNSSADITNEIDHAEVTALRRLVAREPGLDLSTVTLYSTMEPCLMCFSTFILNNVHTMVYGYEDAMGGGAHLDRTVLSPLYRDMKITVIPHILRHECLALFKKFFADPQNGYWRGSYLAEYTLNQS